MAEYGRVVKRNPKLTAATWLDDVKARRNKSIFAYHGVHIYCGWQGSGKTASMVYHLRKVKKAYPNALISSNLNLVNLKAKQLKLTEVQEQKLGGVASHHAQRRLRQYLAVNLHKILEDIDPTKEYILYEDANELATIMHLVKRGTAGHIIVADEIHLYLNSVKSKDTTIETFAAISQLRKNKTLIIGSSQLATRLEKAVREQMTTIIKCNTRFGVFTSQVVYDAHTLEYDRASGKLEGDIVKRGFFVQTRDLRNSYDTLQIVQPSEMLYERSLDYG